MMWTAAAVVGGRWAGAKGNASNLQVGVALLFLTLFLTGLSAVNGDLASALATLILISALLLYAAKPLGDTFAGLTGHPNQG
jgi:hypothetical protein